MDSHLEHKDQPLTSLPTKAVVQDTPPQHEVFPILGGEDISPISTEQVVIDRTQYKPLDFFNELVAEDVFGRSNAFYKVAGYELTSDTDDLYLRVDSLAVDELPHLTFQATDASRREATGGVAHFLQHFPNRSHLTVLAVDGDGYCLLHAVSVALVGDESLWSYLRELLRHELVRKSKTPPSSDDLANLKRLDPENDGGDDPTLRDLSSDHVKHLAAILRRIIVLVTSKQIEIIIPKSQPGEPELIYGSPLVIGMSKAASVAGNHYVPIVPKVCTPVTIPLEALMALSGVIVHEGLEDFRPIQDPVELASLIPGGHLTMLVSPPSPGLQDLRAELFQRTMVLFPPSQIERALRRLPSIGKALALLGLPLRQHLQSQCHENERSCLWVLWDITCGWTTSASFVEATEFLYQHREESNTLACGTVEYSFESWSATVNGNMLDLIAIRRLTDWECPQCTLTNHITPSMFDIPIPRAKPLMCAACYTQYDPVIDNVQPTHHKEHQTYIICTGTKLFPYHYVVGQKSLQLGPTPTWVCGCTYINPLRTEVCEVCSGTYVPNPDEDPRLVCGGPLFTLGVHALRGQNIEETHVRLREFYGNKRFFSLRPQDGKLVEAKSHNVWFLF